MSVASVLVTLTLQKAGDPNGDRWPSAISGAPTWAANPVQMALNQSQDLFVQLSGIVRDSVEVEVEGGRNFVVFRDPTGSAPFGPPLLFEDDRGIKLWPATDAQLRRHFGRTWKGTQENPGLRGRPENYVMGLEGHGKAWLHPCPRDDAVFRAYMAAKPLPMLEGNAQPFINNQPNVESSPVQYHEALTYRAAAILLEQNQDAQNLALAATYMAIFDQRVGQAAAEVKEMLGG